MPADTTPGFAYAPGDRAEVREYGEWMPVTIAGRFIGPKSGEPVYVIAGASDRDRYRYESDLRPVPQSLRVAP
jgi:hypothetical protein